jgi:hypothetical protein
LRNPWNSCGPEVPQKPKNDEDDDEKFEHERFLSIASARLTSVPLLGVTPGPKGPYFRQLLRDSWRIGTNENREHTRPFNRCETGSPLDPIPSCAR